MAIIRQAIDRLQQAYGPQGWWPAASGEGVAEPWEVVVGAVLVQHTAWRNVVQAVQRLERADAMSIARIETLSHEELAELIRPAGPPRVKATRLKNVASWLIEHYEGRVETLLAGVDERRVALQRREELLKINGVGPETADAILLYAGGAPIFVVDAYKRRVMQRHGWGEPDASYGELQRWWERRLPRDASVYNEAHALLVQVGVDHCRKRNPRCEACPLRPLLPTDGPLAD